MTIQTRRSPVAQPSHVLEDIDVEIIAPKEATNLCTNGSFEVNTTGWANDGFGTITRTVAKSFYGKASAVVSVATSGGAAFTVPATAGNTYTLSFVYTKTTTNPAHRGKCYIEFLNGGGSVVNSDSFDFPRGNVAHWARASLTLTAAATVTQIRIRFANDGSSGQWDVWIDGVQIEATPYWTSYIDGTRPGCVWLGQAHNSQSYRGPNVRTGGRHMSLRSAFGFAITAMIGFGAPPTTPQIVPFAQIGGADYQQSYTASIPLQIAGVFERRSREQMAYDRRRLYEAVRPETGTVHRPARMLIRRHLETQPLLEPADGVIVDAVYTGGLEGNQTNDQGIETAALGFQVYLPFAALGTSLRERSSVLTTNETIGSYTTFAIRNYLTGAFLGSGINPGSEIFAAVFDANNNLYIGGSFGVKKYDPVANTLTTIGSTPISGGRVYALEFDGGGILYAGGDFTTPVANFAQLSAGAWTGVGGGATIGRVDALKFDPKLGRLYAGGSFTQLGGTAAQRIAFVVPGIGITSLATTMGGGIGVIEIGPDSTVYVANGSTQPELTDINGITTQGIARYLPYTAVWAPLGTGLDHAALFVCGLTFGKDGMLYAMGLISTADGIAVNNFARWNGQGWQPVGSGLDNGGVGGVATSVDGILIGAGQTTASGKEARGTSTWTGYKHLRYDFEPYSSGLRGITVSADERYIAFWGVFTSALQPDTTIVNVRANAGPTYPTITFDTHRVGAAGPGRLVALRNWTTKQSIFFDLDLANYNEVLTLATGPGYYFQSDQRGDMRQVVYGDPRSFRLNPGDNIIQVQILGVSGGGGVTMTWNEAAPSLDYIP